MFALFALSLTVGLADSLNPTTVGPALFLATTSRARSALISFIAAVFGVYFLGGLLITLGPGELILSIAPHPRRDVRHILELVVGVLSAVAAVATWFGRHRLQARAPRIRQTSPRSAFVLGASIMLVELPTAFPYFAVIAADVASGRNIVVKVIALAIFNAAFVLPLVAILFVREYAGDQAQEKLERFGEWFQRNSAAIVAVLLALASVGFLLAGTIGLLRTPHRRHARAGLSAPLRGADDPAERSLYSSSSRSADSWIAARRLAEAPESAVPQRTFLNVWAITL